MSYGDQLDAAAAGLARVYAGLRGSPPASVEARAAAVLARVRLYRGLELQVLALGNVHAGELPPVGEVPARWRGVGRSPLTTLAIELRQAGAATIAANWVSRLDLPVAGQVAHALQEAAEAVQTAGDILISNTGAEVGPARRHRPRTSDGMAIVAGVGRPDNVSAVARLAAAAALIDGLLGRWLRPQEADGELQEVLDAAQRDIQRTADRSLRHAALLVAAAGRGDRAPVLEVTAAASVEDPLRWAHPESVQDCVAAVDAARTWLFRHPDDLTVGQVAALARAAVALTHCVEHVRTEAGSGWPVASTEVNAAVSAWRSAASACTNLRSPAPAYADRSTMTIAIGSAAAWLHQQVRTGGQWRNPQPWASDETTRGVWLEAAVQITARMPDLVDLLIHSLDRTAARGGVLAPTGGLRAREGQLIATPDWVPVLPSHDGYRALRSALTRAATASRTLAAAAGIPARPGLTAAGMADQQAYVRPAHLAAQWYPHRNSPATPNSPARTERLKPDNQHQSSRRRGR